ncbi:MAG: hypothetical protein KAI66_09430, partial [Lentisphaeria bacterium]|nr:hypothetical protein [Lentisphaeria bacterium]
PKLTESMLGMMLLHDIVSSATQAHLPTIDKLWGIRIKHNLDRAEFVRFSQNKDFTSSNPSIVSSFYRLPGGKLFAVLVNRSKTDQTSHVSFGASYQSAFEEWEGKALPLANDALDITIPGRMFRIVVLMGRK